MLRALIVGAFGAFGLIPAAAAGVIVVPADQPTIQAAVDVAVDGDEIQISGGVYTEAVVITNGANLLLTGKGKVRLLAPLDGTALTLDGCSGVTLQKLSFEGPGRGLAGAGGGGITVRKCRFLKIDTGIALSGVAGAIIDDNIFMDIRDSAVFATGSSITATGNLVRRARYGFRLTGFSVSATDNTLREITDSAFFLASADPATDSAIDDNFIDRCGGCGIWFASLQMEAGQFSIRRNVIRRATYAGIAGQNSVKLAIEQNKLQQTGNFAVQIPASGGSPPAQLVVLENDARKLLGHGFDIFVNGVPSVDAAIVNNVVMDAGLDGMRTNASAVTGNTVSKCARIGIQLNAVVAATLEDHSTLAGNTLLGNRLFDLYNAWAFNVILPDNTIGSTGP